MQQMVQMFGVRQVHVQGVGAGTGTRYRYKVQVQVQVQVAAIKVFSQESL